MKQLVIPNLNIQYRGGWCQKANENSVGQSGVYPSAYKAFRANTIHTELPPRGFYVPVYLNMPNGPKDPDTGVQQDDVAISCPDGSVAAAAKGGLNRPLFRYPSLQAYIADYARNNGGATYRGYGEYIGTVKVIDMEDAEVITKENYKQLEEIGAFQFGKDFNFDPNKSFDEALQLAAANVRYITKDIENQFADGATGIKNVIGWENYNSQFVGKPLNEYAIPCVMFWNAQPKAGSKPATQLKPGVYEVK